jgi:hypothetical protein
MKIKNGDIVIINREKAYIKNKTLPSWYSNKIFNVIKVENNVAYLHENLPNNSNKINIAYLKSLKIERKNKLLKLETLNICGSKIPLINS